MKSLLSPKELAAAIGVSESSVKRWVDEGRLEACRTAGGHRRIALAEAVKFLRASQQKPVRPALFGLPEVLGAESGGLAEAAGKLGRLLGEGAGAAARGLLLQLYFEGYSLAEIFDGPLRQALDQIGHLWEVSSEGIYVEHRASQICLQAVHELRSLLPENPQGPLALGGTPSPDPAQLPSLVVASLLIGEGFRAVNLGPDLPLPVLANAVLAERPALVWLSISHEGDSQALEHEIALLQEKATAVGAAVVIGGRAAPRCTQLPTGRFLRGQSMAELLAFVRGLGLIR